eukprot:TRINITY_DN67277_c0_g1_i1.p1 TRINITY_DN67277_c0_g1~~TRINITY_DN67277_c0_g1_i1.p1  ORF type:complete len:553 (-),score=68.79 TRINITY_DN67277_c0_g1_i1:23-1681(-)
MWLKEVKPDERSLRCWLAAQPGIDVATADLRIRPSLLPGLGDGVFAGRDVPPGGVLARIPATAVLSCDNVDGQEPFNTELAVACRAAGLPLPPRMIKLLLYIIHARHRQDAPQHPWFRNSPAAMNSPIFWREEELQYHLNRSTLLTMTRRHRLYLWREFCNYVQPLTVTSTASFPSDIFTFHALLCAWSVTASRGYPVSLVGACEGGHPTAKFILCPLLDLFNHRSNAPIEWRDVKETGGSIEFRLLNSCPRSVRKGEEVWNDYGPNSNEDLLLNFGFCSQDNVHDRVQLIVTAVAVNQTSGDAAVEAWVTRRVAALRRFNLPILPVPGNIRGAIAIGPFFLCRVVGRGLGQAGKPRLPPSLLAALAVFDEDNEGCLLRPPQLAAALKELSACLQGLPAGSLKVSDGRHHLGVLSEMYRNGQRALLEDVAADVETVSEPFLRRAVSRFVATNAFLDRLEASNSDVDGIAVTVASAPADDVCGLSAAEVQVRLGFAGDEDFLSSAFVGRPAVETHGSTVVCPAETTPTVLSGEECAMLESLSPYFVLQKNCTD